MYKTSLSEFIYIINFYDMDDKQRALNHASSMRINPATENADLMEMAVFRAKKYGEQLWEQPCTDHSKICAEDIAISEEIENESCFTLIEETGSKLNTNYEPYVPSRPLEQVSENSIPGSSDCEVNPFNLNELYQKVCRNACGRPGHIAKHCLHRSTEFFYGMNQKVTPKAIPISRPKRIEKSYKPKAKKA
ncbi:hypothetical protein R6Q57_019573 [Mikania cordata]